MAKNVSVIALLAAVKRGFWKKRMSSIGWSVCSSQAMNDVDGDDADGEARRAPAGRSSPCAGPSMMPNSRRAEADDRQHARRAGRACRWLGSFDVGHEEVAGDEGDDADREVDPEHRAPREVLEQQAAGDRADGHAEAGEPGPDGDRPAPLAGVAEDVGEDRQRRRHDQRPADAHEGPAGDQLRRSVVDSAADDRADARTGRCRSAGRPCGRSGR